MLFHAGAGSGAGSFSDRRHGGRSFLSAGRGRTRRGGWGWCRNVPGRCGTAVLCVRTAGNRPIKKSISNPIYSYRSNRFERSVAASTSARQSVAWQWWHSSRCNGFPCHRHQAGHDPTAHAHGTHHQAEPCGGLTTAHRATALGAPPFGHPPFLGCAHPLSARSVVCSITASARASRFQRFRHRATCAQTNSRAQSIVLNQFDDLWSPSAFRRARDRRPSCRILACHLVVHAKLHLSCGAHPH